MNEVAPQASQAPPRSPRTGFVTEQSVYGIILVSGLIVVSGAGRATAWETFLSVIATVVVFWGAHVYAGTITEHRIVDGVETTLTMAFRRSLRRSLGLLTAALLPSIILLLGATRAVPDVIAMWAALWLCVLILAVIGYTTFALRGDSWPIRILGCLGTASFGLAMIVLKALVH